MAFILLYDPPSPTNPAGPEYFRYSAAISQRTSPGGAEYKRIMRHTASFGIGKSVILEGRFLRFILIYHHHLLSQKRKTFILSSPKKHNIHSPIPPFFQKKQANAPLPLKNVLTSQCMMFVFLSVPIVVPPILAGDLNAVLTLDLDRPHRM